MTAIEQQELATTLRLPPLDAPQISAETRHVAIGRDGELFVKVLRGPLRSGRRAIYIHGGGGGGNHTLIERPSRYLIHDGLFDEMLLPDRRGDGASSPLTHKQTVREHAEDMRDLLDAMGEAGPLTALGVSYGGPIALGLAAIDMRIERVVLVASSPALSQNNGVARLLIKSGVLRPMMKLVYRAYLGKLPPEYTDFDRAYDMRQSRDLVNIFLDAVKRTPREHMDSFIYALEATLDEANANLDAGVALDIPVVQVIGQRDEVWGSSVLPQYKERFPHFRQYIVPEGRIHKDVFLKPGAFYSALAAALRETS
jgi:pimeloyl-ACP methyl ester carboxylesterase